MDLELKIKALVEGLANVNELAKALRQTGDESVQASTRTDAAFKTIGVRPFVEIRTEIDKVRAAYRELSSSGTLTAKELAIAADASKDKIKNLNQELAGVRDSSSTAGSGLAGLQSAIAPAVAGFLSLSAAIGAIKKASEAAIELDRIKIALQATIGSAEGARSEFAFVREEAFRLGLNLQQSAKDYTSLTAATKGTTLAGQKTRDIFTAVSEASSVLGLSADSTSGALLAIQQIVSKGTVSAEELRGQLGERLPGAFQIAARSIGVTTAELGRLLESGAIAADDFLPKFAAELKKTFADGLPGAVGSARAEFERLQNAIFETAAAVGQSGLNQGLAEAAKVLREDLSDPLILASLKTIGEAIGFIATALARLVGFLTTSFVPVFGVLFGGLKDGFTIIGAAILGLAGIIVTFAANFLNAFGTVIRYINKDLGDAIIGASNNVREVGKSLTGYADEVTENFKKGESALGQFNKELEKSPTAAAKSANETEILIKQALDSYTALGLKLVEIGGQSYLVPVNAEFDGLNKKVKELAANGLVTSTEFRQAFSKGLDSAKTLTDIGDIGKSLETAAKQGKDVGDAARQINARFEEVFTTALKTAKTTDDFKLLEAQLKQLGKNGTVPVKLIDDAVLELNKRLKDTQAETALTAKQLTELGRATVDVAKAHLNVARADYEVGRSRIDVWKAQNKYANDGSDLSREELRLAELNLRLAQTKAAEARLAYAEEKAHRDVILATHREQLALIRLQIQPGNEALILAEKAAKAGVEGAQAAYEVAKQRTEAQQELTLKVEEEVLQQKLVVDQARAVSEQTKEASKQAGDYANKVKEAAGHVNTAATGAATLSKNLSGAAGAASGLTANLKGATEQQLRLATAIQGLYSAQRNLDALQGNNPGVTSFTNPDQINAKKGEPTGGSDNSRATGTKIGNVAVAGDPNQPARPTSLQDFIDNGKNNSNFTNSDGVVYSKNSQGQLGNNQTPQGTQTISAEENRFFDFKEGKIAVPDRRDTEFLLQKLAAARANLEVADALPAGFGGEFRRSAQASFNVIRRALEALGISTAVGGTAGLNDGSGGLGGFAAANSRTGGNAGGFGALPSTAASNNASPYSASALLERITPASAITPSADAFKGVTPDKTIEVVFTDGTGNKVPTTVSAKNEQSLIELLERAKGIAA